MLKTAINLHKPGLLVAKSPKSAPAKISAISQKIGSMNKSIDELGRILGAISIACAYLEYPAIPRCQQLGDFQTISDLEIKLGHTIDNKRSIIEMANAGTPYPCNPITIAAANSTTWNSPIFVEDWQLPSGAFGEQNGCI